MKTIVLFTLALFPISALTEERYTIVQIEAGPSAPPTAYSHGIGINNLGAVVGFFGTPETRLPEHPFRYSRKEGMVDLGPTGIAVAINDSGQIAGAGNTAFRWSPGIGYEPLGTFGGSWSYAEGMNSRGQVTGWSYRADGSQSAFRFTDGIGIQELGVGQVGGGINDRGWVTGADGLNAFLFRDDVGAVYLGPGAARALNNRGVVAGAYGYPFSSFAVLWFEGQTRFLGTLGGGYSEPYSINEKNQVVGSSERKDRAGAGFIWTEQEGMVDLNSLVDSNTGWFLGEAEGINENGWIVGTGYYQEKEQAYLLIPIQPSLHIETAGTNVSLSWTPQWPGLVLEAAPASDTNHWQAVPGGTNSPVLVPISADGQVFRLTQYDSFDPVLSLTVAGTNLVVSWSPPWPDYVLEASPGLTLPTWTPVPGGTNSPVTLPASCTGCFFRLRK